MLPRISSQSIGKEFGLFRGELSCYWLVVSSLGLSVLYTLLSDTYSHLLELYFVGVFNLFSSYQWQTI